VLYSRRGHVSKHSITYYKTKQRNTLTRVRVCVYRVCHMESIVRILRFLLQYYPEYTVVCDAANMVEMTEMHFPHVGVCLLGATTEKDQNKYRRYFCHVLLLLRTLCFDGTIQWDAYTQMVHACQYLLVHICYNNDTFVCRCYYRVRLMWMTRQFRRKIRCHRAKLFL
jgi:hypothetical protein